MEDALLRPLHALLERGLARSAAARDVAGRLEGRTLAIRLSDTRLALFLHVRDGGVVLDRHYSDDPDALLVTTALGIGDLLRGRIADAGPGRLAVSGDPAVAADFEQLLRLTRPDLEEELSTVVGDVAAHQIGNAVRGLFAFGQRAVNTIARNGAEFLQEESRDVPAVAEAEIFVEDVTKLAGEIEALERRLTEIDERTR